MSDSCRWLHIVLKQMPVVKFPFIIEKLPHNAIYFFYEKGENWGHCGNKPRIVRVGTHRQGNFKSRISEHFLLDEAKMRFDMRSPKPSDRSIFRKNIGRALLNKHGDGYLKIWNEDFTSRDKRESSGHIRDMPKEKNIETEITRLIREQFSFRFIMIDDQKQRIGSKGLESSLIATVANCTFCKASAGWLGNYSPIRKIMQSGLWQVQHLNDSCIDEKDVRVIVHYLLKTKQWLTLSG